MAQFKTKQYFLGAKAGKSDKTGAEYFLVKTQDDDENIYEWYVSSKNPCYPVVEGGLKKFYQYDVILEVRSYQGKPQIDLIGVGA